MKEKIQLLRDFYQLYEFKTLESKDTTKIFSFIINLFCMSGCIQ